MVKHSRLKTDPFELIQEELKSGRAIRLRGMGKSMYPTIMPGDRVVLEEPKDLKNGDIVALRAKKDLILVHRILKIFTHKGRKFVKTIGDNCKEPDGRFVIEQVIGKVVEIIKDE